MIIVYILISLVTFVITGWLGGYLYVRKYRDALSLIDVITAGNIINILVLTILNMVLAVLHMSLTALGFTWMVYLTVIAVISIVKYRKNFISDLILCTGCKDKLSDSEEKESCKNRKNAILILKIAVIVLIGAQLVGLNLFSDNRLNSIRQVMYATSAYDTGELSLKSPMMMLWALVARVLKCHPLIVMSVSQYIMLPLFYSVWWMCAKKLTEDDKNRWFMMFILCLLNLWGYQSEYLINTTLLFT